MSVNERNFSSFELGDDVYQLADGLLPEIAEKLEVTIADTPNSDDLQNLLKKVGSNKVLRNNADVTAIERDEMVDILERSDIQAPLQRSLWTPETSNLRHVGARIVMGAVANWQDRVANKFEHEQAYTRLPIFLLSGSREMSTATEVTNPNIEHIKRTFGRYPTEGEYAASVILPRLTRWGRNVMATSYPTEKGSDMLREFFTQNPTFLERKISAVRVANAGVAFALQVRAAARTLNPEFDSDPSYPQLFVETDTLPLARTDEQVADPTNYQKPDTALRQLILTAKLLHEADTTS